LRSDDFSRRSFFVIELHAVDVACSARQLAEIVGTSSRSIERLTADGILKTLRSGKQRGRRYKLSDAVQSYLKHERDRLREQSSNGDSAYEDARARKMNAAALIEEMRARQLSGELIKRSTAVNVMTQVISLTKSRLLGVPSQCMHQLVGRTSPIETNQIVRDRIVAALRELAQFDPDTLQRKMLEQKNGADDVVDSSSAYVMSSGSESTNRL
jgi:phage terminase Nu1 subunit (DNA packaging protein)